MLEGIQGYSDLSGYDLGNQAISGTVQRMTDSRLLERAAQAATPEDRQKIKDEFLAIFYKELLKQTFKAPNFSGEENGNSISSAFAGDLMVDQLALTLAQAKQFSADALLGAGIESEDLR